MISHELEVSLNLAVSEAARRGHEYVTVEHVLFALLQVTRKCLIQIPVMIPLNQIFNILP